MSKRIVLKKKIRNSSIVSREFSDSNSLEEFNSDIKGCSDAKLFSTDNKSNRITLDKWVLSNRKNFPQFINKDFIEMTQKDNRHNIKKWSSSNNQFTEIIPFRHQKFVSDFLSENSPYRGLLLYHGLGSGKSGASVMIGEGFKHRKVVILVPASLHNNYADELQTFSEISYRKNFHWCFIRCPKGSFELEQKYFELLEEKGIHKDLVISLLIEKRIDGKEYRGIWMIDYTKDRPNYEDLAENDRIEVDNQIKTMFDNKYTILHYNSGAYTLTKIFEKLIPTYNIIYSKLFGSKKVSTLTNKDKDKLLNFIYDPINKIENPFDNKVLIIDEIHNLTSTMVGAKYNGSRLYELIVRASNLKIVFLSGTPVINYAYELALMFNMLSGLLYSFTIPVKNTQKSFSKEELEKCLTKINIIDRFVVDLSNSNIEITRTPYGFINKYLGEENIGVYKSDYNTGNDEWFINKVLEELSVINYQKAGEPVKNTYSIFPDYLVKSNTNSIMLGNGEYIENARDSFNDAYIDQDKGEIRNENHFKNRITGLVSFYNEISGKDSETGANLFPDKIDASAEETTVMMSDVQFIEYAAKREIERELENLKRRGKKESKDGSDKDPNYFRVFSRQKGLFVFPPNISRPKPPKKGKQIITDVVSGFNLKDEAGKTISVHNDEVLRIYQTLDTILNEKNERETKLKEYIESLDNDIHKKIVNELIKKFQETYSEQSSVSYKNNVLNLYSFSLSDLIDGVEEIHTSEYDEENYSMKCREAINQLTRDNLTIDGEGHNIQKLSPKYSLMLQNINNSPGNVFCYSQFRSVEGIEIFARMLDFAGYSRVNFRNNSIDLDNGIVKGSMVRYKFNSRWSCYKVTSINKTNNTLKLEGISEDVNNKDVHRCHYALWTGTETPEQRKAIQKLYNSIENMYGQECLILLTTQSGSEGISLLHVRQVHIMEPYWNNVRIDQVVGRARRIKSHVLLPEEDRNVKVFKYIIKFTTQQKDGSWIDNIEHKDILDLKSGEENGFEKNDFEVPDKPEINDEESKNRYEKIIIEGFKKYAKKLSENISQLDNGLTSDETLEQISINKQVLLGKFLKLIKESALDCKFNKSDNLLSDETLADLNCSEYIVAEGKYTYDFKSNISATVGDLKVKDYILKAQQIKLIIPYNPKKNSKNTLKVLIIIPPNLHSIKDTKDRFNRLPDKHPIYNYYTYYGLDLSKTDIHETLEEIGQIDKKSGNSTFKFREDYVKKIEHYLLIEECINENLNVNIDIQSATEADKILWANKIKECHRLKLEEQQKLLEIEKARSMGTWTCLCGKKYASNIDKCPDDDMLKEEILSMDE